MLFGIAGRLSFARMGCCYNFWRGRVQRVANEHGWYAERR